MAASWKVTSDTPDQYDFDAAGAPVIGHVIRFQTGTGATGSVFVPEAHYNANSVRALVAGKANTADEIAALSSEPAAG